MSFYEVIKKYSYEYVKDLIYNADEKYKKMLFIKKNLQRKI